MIYYGRLQSPRPALSAKNALNVPQHASGPFPSAVLASGFSLDLVTNLVLLECLNTSIAFFGFYFDIHYSLIGVHDSINGGLVSL
jgi:hypothetical protein